MWVPPGHSRPTGRTARAPRAFGRAVAALFALAAACFALSTLAQNAPAPSADSAGDDTSRFPPWFRDFVETVRTNSTRGRELAVAKLTEAQTTGDRSTEIYAHLAVATALRIQNDITGALVHSREALALVERFPSDLLKYNSNYIHGLNLNALGDTAGAVEYFLRALPYADARQSARARATTLAALASAYAKLNDLDQALAYEREALALAEKTGDERAVGMYSSNLAGLEEDRGNLVAARALLQRALVIKRAEGNRTQIADLEERVAMLDFAEGRADAALAALDPILAQRRTLRGKVKLTNTLLHRAKILLSLRRLDEALAHAEEARGYAEGIEARNLRRSVFARLAEIHEARGDAAAALAATRREFAEREAMAGEAAKTRAAELQVQFDVTKKDLELARLARENELRAAEKKVQDAQLTAQTAELRAKEAGLRAAAAELHARDADLAQTRLSRYLLGAGLGSAVLALAGLAAFQRYRLRAKQRLLEQTRTARDAAEEADRLKTRFLSVASHDLRAPLGNILHLADSLRASARDGLAPTADLDLVSAEAQRVLVLVEDLLTTASLESGKLELRRAPTDLTEVTHAVVAGLRWQARAKDQSLVFHEPAPDAGRLTADAARLYQVVANLVTNAIKFSPPDTTITLALTRTATHVTLSVRDEGPGLAPADLAKLFVPFERRTASPTGRESSHGLGLSIAHEIVRLHGGEIRVESAPARGATFFVDLPAA